MARPTVFTDRHLSFPKADTWRLLLVNPAFVVPLTFMVGYLIWFFFSTDLPSMPGIAPRRDTSHTQFLFFLLFGSFAAGMALVAFFRIPQAHASGLTDTEWLAVGLVSAAITFGGEAFFLRSLIANPGALLANDLTVTLAVVGTQLREGQVLGISSLNNLFPIPASIAAMLVFTRRPLPRSARFQAGALLFAMGCMTLVHAVLASSRIWFLSFVLACFVAWVVQRRQSLRTQLNWILVILVVGGAFVVATELLRSLGVQLKSAGINISEPGVIAYAVLRLLQAYPASDVNNAMIVLDCPSPQYLVSNVDIISRLASTISGVSFEPYSACPGWTSWFGTINFVALVWWDWSYAAPAVTFAIGVFVQTTFAKAVEVQDRLSFATVLLPATLFAAMHLTRSFALGQTLFVLPLLFIVAVWATGKIGGRALLAAR
jgi:hypothetical protein